MQHDHDCKKKMHPEEREVLDLHFKKLAQNDSVYSERKKYEQFSISF